MHIDRSYIRCGDLQLRKLFKKQSVTEAALSMQAVVATKIAELKYIAAQKSMPSVSTGAHCIMPYTCDFHSFCNSAGGHGGMFESSETALPVNDGKIILPSVQCPAYVLYIGTYRIAVPAYDGHWPYRNIPFIFSLKKVEADSSGITPSQTFVADHASDPCMQIVEQLAGLNALNGTIMVDDKKFISARLTELQNDYPGYAACLEQVKEQLEELPFSEKELTNHINGNSTINASLLMDEHQASVLFCNLQYETAANKIAAAREILGQYAEHCTNRINSFFCTR